MKIKKISAIVLSLIMSVSIFCIVPAVSAESGDKSVYDISSATAKTNVSGGEEKLDLTVAASTNYDGIAWIAFKLKTGEKGEVTVGFKESGGAMYWWPNEVMHTSYLVAADGTVTETSNKSQGNLIIPSAFEGYVVTSISELSCHPGYASHDTDGKLTLNDLSEMRFWNHKDTEWEFSNVKLGKTKEALIASICPDDASGEGAGSGAGTGSGEGTGTGTGTGEAAKAVMVSEDKFTSVDMKTPAVTNKATDDASRAALKNAKYFGFYFKTEKNANIQLLLKETEAGGNGGYWTKQNVTGNIKLVKADGTEITSTVANDAGWITVSEAFEGYVIIDLNDLTTHPAASHSDSKGAFNPEELDHIEIIRSLNFGGEGTGFDFAKFAFATSEDELLKLYGVKTDDGNNNNNNNGTGTGNENNGNDNGTTVTDIPKSVMFSEDKFTSVDMKTPAIANKVTDDASKAALKNAKYFGFYLKTNSAAQIQFLLKETEAGGKGGYWLKKNVERNVYLFTADGTETVSNACKDQGTFTLSGAFEGYVVFDLNDFETHPGHNDTDGALDLSELDHIEIIRSLNGNGEGTGFDFAKFAFATSKKELLKLYGIEIAGDEELDSVVKTGDTQAQNVMLTLLFTSAAAAFVLGACLKRRSF